MVFLGSRIAIHSQIVRRRGGVNGKIFPRLRRAWPRPLPHLVAVGAPSLRRDACDLDGLAKIDTGNVRFDVSVIFIRAICLIERRGHSQASRLLRQRVTFLGSEIFIRRRSRTFSRRRSRRLSEGLVCKAELNRRRAILRRLRERLCRTRDGLRRRR